jgi:hypothetical protein
MNSKKTPKWRTCLDVLNLVLSILEKIKTLVTPFVTNVFVLAKLKDITKLVIALVVENPIETQV